MLWSERGLAHPCSVHSRSLVSMELSLCSRQWSYLGWQSLVQDLQNFFGLVGAETELMATSSFAFVRHFCRCSKFKVACQILSDVRGSTGSPELLGWLSFSNSSWSLTSLQAAIFK